MQLEHGECSISEEEKKTESAGVQTLSGGYQTMKTRMLPCFLMIEKKKNKIEWTSFKVTRGVLLRKRQNHTFNKYNWSLVKVSWNMFTKGQDSLWQF